MSPVASYLVQTVVTLAGVAALAFVLLHGARRAGLGRPTGPLALLGRLPLDPRRTVYLVRVGETVYVLAASEGSVVKLGETTERALAAQASRPATPEDAP